GARAVLLELGADQVDVFRRVEEAVRGAVQRDEALAALDEVEQRLLLFRGNLGGVGVDHQPVVAGEQLWIEGVHLVGVGELDAALFQHRLQLAEALRRPVVAVVAEEEDLDGLRVFSMEREAGQQTEGDGKSKQTSHGYNLATGSKER